MATPMTSTQRLLWRSALELSSRFQTATTTTTTTTMMMGRTAARGVPSVTSMGGRSRRAAYSTQPPPRKRPNDAVKFWPFALVIAMGSGAYVMLARTRAENRYAPRKGQ
ncbi:hypothetical protein F5X96DRAFT_657477 [Biscogniauxia mediterranea]|nr:hypothetical protein F5X96DRAFT_657477 [Biscogniauxia mediterranea]